VVANGLQTGIRRGRIDTAYRDAALSDLGPGVPVGVRVRSRYRAGPGTLRLADRCGLTLYDASYLELAQRRSLPLASLDMALCDAAKALGVELVASSG
jgi:hypothetical protein